jgi:DNA-binding HxlR family transcriptional regulator
MPATKRSYGQFCGVARALDRLGERWTLLLVRELLLGPRRYSQLLAGLPGVTTNLLAKRLRELESNGVIERFQGGYRLTAAGRELEPVIAALGDWGARFLDKPLPTDAVDPGWALLSLRRRYRGGVEGQLQLDIAGKTFELVCTARELQVLERVAARPDVVVAAEMSTLKALLDGRGNPPVRVVHGDRALWTAFCDSVRAA